MDGLVLKLVVTPALIGAASLAGRRWGPAVSGWLLCARLAGLVSPFLLYAAILAIFAHRLAGPGAAAGVLRGLLLGLFSFAGFFLVLAALLVPAGITIAFAGATAVALAVQGGSLWALRRLPA
jgi:hypothetical protein